MESQTQESVSVNNSNYVNNSALQTRLDVTTIISDFKLNLSGKGYETKLKEDGTMGLKMIDIGQPRANERGVQALGSFVSNSLNTQVVQGNFMDEEMYFLAVDNLEDSLRSKLIMNAPLWDIADEEIEGLYDEIKNLISTFLTRLLYNKERESYSDTIRTVENNTLQNKSGFGFFKE